MFLNIIKIDDLKLASLNHSKHFCSSVWERKAHTEPAQRMKNLECRRSTMLKKFCDEISKQMKSCSRISNEEVEIASYGLKLLAFELVVDSIILTTCFLLGIAHFTIIATVVFGLLRILGGGAHSGSRVECFVFYNLIIWSTIYVSMKISIETQMILIMMIANLLVFLKYAPGDTEAKPLYNRKRRRTLKALSILAVVAVYTVAIWVNQFNSTSGNIMVLSAMSAMLLLTPFGYWICRCKKGTKL
jgi:accessory gene regulator B